MASLGSLIVRLGADTGNFDAGMRRAAERLETVADIAERAGRNLTVGITAPVLAVGAAAIRTAAEFESLRRGLEAVAGGTEEAERQLARLREVAKLPGLGLREAIQGATNLQAAGYSADLAERSLRAFGNALATVGRGKAELDGVTRTLGQIASKGKISGEEISQLAERVPQIRVAMKAAFGTADTEVLQKAKISATDFVTRVVAELEKLPQVTGGTQNAFENLADTVAVSLDRLGSGSLNAVTENMNRLAGVVQGLTDRFLAMSPEGQRNALILAGIAAAAGPATVAIAALVRAYGTLNAVIVGSTIINATRTWLALIPAIRGVADALYLVRIAGAAMLGPMGVAVLALGSLSLAFFKAGEGARRAAQAAKQAADDFRAALAGMSDAQALEAVNTAVSQRAMVVQQIANMRAAISQQRAALRSERKGQPLGTVTTEGVVTAVGFEPSETAAALAKNERALANLVKLETTLGERVMATTAEVNRRNEAAQKMESPAPPPLTIPLTDKELSRLRAWGQELREIQLLREFGVSPAAREAVTALSALEAKIGDLAAELATTPSAAGQSLLKELSAQADAAMGRVRLLVREYEVLGRAGKTVDTSALDRLSTPEMRGFRAPRVLNSDPSVRRLQVLNAEYRRVTADLERATFGRDRSAAAAATDRLNALAEQIKAARRAVAAALAAANLTPQQQAEIIARLSVDLDTSDFSGSVKAIEQGIADVSAAFGDLGGALVDLTRGVLGAVLGAKQIHEAQSMSGLAQVAGTVAGVGAIVGGLTSLVSAVTAADRERNRVIQANTAKLEETRLALQGFASTAANIRSAGIAAARIGDLSNLGLVGPTTFRDGKLEGYDASRIQKVLSSLGISFAQLNKIAKDNGIELLDSKGRIVARAFDQLSEQLGYTLASLTRLGADLESQRSFAELLDDVQNVAQTPLRVLQRELGLLETQAPDLLRRFGLAGLDPTVLGDRNAIRQGLESIMVAIRDGVLDPTLLGGLQGLPELFGSIQNIDNALDDAAEAANKLSESLTNVPPLFDRALRTMQAARIGAGVTSQSTTDASRALASLRFGGGSSYEFTYAPTVERADHKAALRAWIRDLEASGDPDAQALALTMRVGVG